MGHSEIGAPTGAYAADCRGGGLWILPDLWKTPRARFPQGPWTARQTAPPTGSTGRHHRLLKETTQQRLRAEARYRILITPRPSGRFSNVPQWPHFNVR